MSALQNFKALLGLFLLTVLFNARESQSAKEGLHLGCKFQDTNYTLVTDKPVYGTPMEPEKFESEDEFLAFIEKVTPIYKEVLTNSVLNDLDALIKFAQEYKAQKPAKNLKEFYDGYQVSYGLVKDGATLTLEFFNKLIKVEPKVADNLYLVRTEVERHPLSGIFGTVIFFNSPSLFYNYASQLDIKEIFVGFVTGALKFEIGGKIGTVIFDPYVGVKEPVVIIDPSWEESKLKGKDSIHGGISERIAFRSVEESFVVSLAYEDDKKRIMQKFLYYTGRPYCSFLSTTSKPMLLSWSHDIQTKLPDGSPKGDIMFKICPIELNEIPIAFMRNDSTTHKIEDLELELIHYSEESRTNMNESTLVEKYAAEVGLTKDDVYDKMALLKALFVDDKTLYKEFYKLNFNLWMVDSNKGNSCEPDFKDVSKYSTCLETSRGFKRILKYIEEEAGRPIFNEQDIEEEDAPMRQKQLAENMKDFKDALPEGAQPEGLHLGCQFEDEYYSLQANSHVFGRRAMEPEQFESEDDFLAFIEKITPIYQEVIKNAYLNDLDALIKFAQEYIAQRPQQDIESFYEDYQLPFGTAKDSSTLVLEFFNKLIEIEPKVADNLFLVRTEVTRHPLNGIFGIILFLRDPSLFYKFQSALDIKEIFRGFVAGALKFEIGGKIGTVIFDPYVGVKEPVVIIDPSWGQSKLTGRDSIQGGVSQRIAFRSVGENYVVSLAYQKDDKRIFEKFLYYTGRPYCSFVSTFSKPMLLSWTHNIQTKYPDGSPKANFIFKISEFANIESMPMLFHSYDEKTHEQTEVMYMFRDIDDNFLPKKNGSEIAMFEKLARDIHLTKDELMEKLKTLKRLFFENIDVYSQFYYLNQRKWAEDIREGDLCLPNVKDVYSDCLQTSRGVKRILQMIEVGAGRPIFNEKEIEAEDAPKYQKNIQDAAEGLAEVQAAALQAQLASGGHKKLPEYGLKGLRADLDDHEGAIKSDGENNRAALRGDLDYNQDDFESDGEDNQDALESNGEDNQDALRADAEKNRAALRGNLDYNQDALESDGEDNKDSLRDGLEDDEENERE